MKGEAPANLRYTEDHEWARSAPGEIVVGITEFAVEQLGDVTLVDLDVEAGDKVEAGKAFGTIESVKTLSDLCSPVSGKVLRVNGALVASPELVNEDCYGKGWMIAVAPEDPKAIAALMDAAAYEAHLGSSH